MTKNISIIVAIAQNNAIGKDNKLLWHISEDLKRFKKITTGHTILMGKNTFHSLPNGPLPNRVNIVITDVKDERFEGCEMAYSIEEALKKNWRACPKYFLPRLEGIDPNTCDTPQGAISSMFVPERVFDAVELSLNSEGNLEEVGRKYDHYRPHYVYIYV